MVRDGDGDDDGVVDDGSRTKKCDTPFVLCCSDTNAHLYGRSE